MGFKTGALFVIREDGKSPVFTALREQDVAAWTFYETDGKILGAGADGLGRTYCLVERNLNGTVRRNIEVLQPDRTLDSSVIVELDDAGTVSGLEHLDGAAVYVVGEEEYFGPLTVAGGELTLPEALTGTYEIGLLFDAYVDLLPPRFQTQRGSERGMKMRVYAVQTELQNSCLPLVTVDGQTYAMQAKETPELDAGPLRAPFHSGPHRLEGFRGWSTEPETRISRNGPGPFKMNGVTREVIY
jgi:hypothetical protein